MVETRDAEHGAEMITELKKHYAQLTYTGLGAHYESEDEEDDETGELNGDSGIGISPGRRSSSAGRRLSIKTMSS